VRRAAAASLWRRAAGAGKIAAHLSGRIFVAHRLAALVAAILAIAAPAAAQQIADPVEWTRGFADRLVAQGGQAAFDYWVEATRGNFDADGQQRFRGAILDIAPQAGVVRRVSSMTEERADDRVMRVRTLYHLAGSPLVVTFYFYRPDNDWRLTTWVTSTQAAEMPYGPPRPVPVGVAAPPPVVPPPAGGPPAGAPGAGPTPLGPPATRSVK
jgi:hypothetical protein